MFNPDVAYPPVLKESETLLLEERRKAAQIPVVAVQEARGVALSGGGIRSATFALGLFQGLAKLQLIRHVDYVSTVSGGGYFGAFLGRLFTRDDVSGTADVEEVLVGKKHPEVFRALRENGRYLAPRGTGDLLLAFAVLLRNWLALMTVILVTALSFLLGLELSRRLVLQIPAAPAPFHALDAWLNGDATTGFWWSTWLVLPMASGLLWALPLGLAYWLERVEAWFLLGGSLVGITVSGAAAWICACRISAGEIERQHVYVAGFGLATFLAPTFAWLARHRATQHWENEQKALPREQRSPHRNVWIQASARNKLSRWFALALIASASLLAVAIIDSLGQTLYRAIAAGEVENWWHWLAGVVAALVSVATGARSLLALSPDQNQSKRIALPAAMIANLVAAIVVLTIAVTLSIVTYAIAFRGQEPRPVPAWLRRDEAKAVLLRGEDISEVGRLEIVLDRGAANSARTQSSATDRTNTAGRSKAAPAAGVLLDNRTDLPLVLVVAFVLALLLAWLFGASTTFLTQSSLHPLYRDRLTRAYLGASNDKRQGETLRNVTEVIDGDDIRPFRYYADTAYAKGAPLHLINVTVNETVDERSGVQQQDRKGTGLAVGPHGFSLGVRHHAVFEWTKREDDPHLSDYIKGTPAIGLPSGPNEGPFSKLAKPNRLYRPQGLSLGKWVAISGAAVSTGLGSRTSLGLSLLAGLTNVRLGYWWDPGLLKGTRWQRLFRVQRCLFKELTARFPGTVDRDWYLSDGGHFENMGAYELIRRRLQSILVIDAEADPDYHFSGLGNLVRKARLDFGAEIRFLDEKQLDTTLRAATRPFFGTLAQLRRGPWKLRTPGGAEVAELEAPREDGLSLAHAALARVTYPGKDGAPQAKSGWLLYVKPTLRGSEPADVTSYHVENVAFPQQTTGDQFFDEEQWESYRRLGSHIAEMLFTSTKEVYDSRWGPRDLLEGK